MVSRKGIAGLVSMVALLLVISVFLVLSGNIEAATGLFLTISGVVIVEALDYCRSEKERHRRAVAIENIVIGELKRNYCVADKHSSSLLSVRAWSILVAGDITDVLTYKQMAALADCCTEIEFYNHDVARGNTGRKKQDRVMRFISGTLKEMDTNPPNENECISIREDWET